MIQFNGQKPGETVRLVSHQHPIVLLPAFLLAGCFLLISVGAFAFFTRGALLSLLIIMGPILAILKIWIALSCWRRTLVLVSTERVAYFQQKSLFQREFYECPLATIMQVSHKVNGLIQTIFGYGTVVVNTGDAESSVVIGDMPDPFDIQQEIQSTIGKA
jgi:hypothetical protein